MTEDFGAAMRQALRAVRGGEVSEATGIIQRALGGGEGPGPIGRMRRPLREVVRTLREGRRAYRTPAARPISAFPARGAPVPHAKRAFAPATTTSAFLPLMRSGQDEAMAGCRPAPEVHAPPA